ncbi:hypothetical protein [Desulfosarcina cetonica]|uniref:hypothetical protein n=1 Tax=Desulfosarcina cetonica TaxID=90730 RepID=UPI0006D1FB63|nr:hypothetical protein [Desulfosarcina cetonica]
MSKQSIHGTCETELKSEDDHGLDAHPRSARQALCAGCRAIQEKARLRTCYACQWCDETRCEVCRANAGQESPPIKDDPAQR